MGGFLIPAGDGAGADGKVVDCGGVDGREMVSDT